MKKSLLDIMCSPCCKAILCLNENSVISVSGVEIDQGDLYCEACKKEYPIINGIPRFVPNENYASSFGFEWKKYGRVQIDSIAGNSISGDRFWATTEWEENSKKGEIILDAGCGGGRFTEIAISTGATLVSFDYSDCIDSTKENFAGRDERLHLAQASIYEMPFEQVFDAVYCMGVLQHTPNPRASLQRLYDVLKPGGELIVDIYYKEEDDNSIASRIKYWSNPQNWLWKPLLKRIPYKWLYYFIKFYVRSFLLIDNKILSLCKNRNRNNKFGPFLRFCRQLSPIEICNYSFQFPFLSKEYWYLWAEMNTLDIYSPKYTQPQTEETMKKWGEELSLKNMKVFIKPGFGEGTGLVLKGVK